jgi:diadenylate cyclase
MPLAMLVFPPVMPRITITSALDVLLVATLVYQLLAIIRGRRAAPVAFGVLVLGVVYVLSSVFQLELLRTVLATLAPYTAFALIVMFQSELRRLLSRLGRSQFPVLDGTTSIERRDLINDIVLAATELAGKRTGALIVLERDIGLRTFIESGTKLDAAVSRDLLLAIFITKGPMHDGAVIIQKDRAAAAACFLPLTMNPALAHSLGTRHRAAIGITEEADCISVVVSEETGQISVATFGEIERDVSETRLIQRLIDHARYRERLRVAPKGASTTHPLAESAHQAKKA